MKIYLDLVGCRLNQSEIEMFARQFTAAGHTLTGDPSEADLAVVNTCTVTTSAAADSRKVIRRLARAGAKQIIATGCWSTLEPRKADALMGVTRVVPNLEKETLVADFLELDPRVLDQVPLEREIIPGGRARTRAMIKVQDGCDNHCSFCVTTIARGKSRSVPIERILQSVRAAVRGGVQEIALTGVHLGSWGKDLDGKPSLAGLIEIILQKTDLARIRLSSIEPWDVDQSLINLINERRVARHLHLPLQSGSAGVLRRMGRLITPGEYADLVSRIRQADPETALTTDIITGFPGESEAEFAETLDFVKEMNFADGHVFTYSARPGTAAARMPDQVAHPLRKERNAVLRELFHRSRMNYQEQFLGRTMEVLWESTQPGGDQGWEMSGLTDNYLRIRTRSNWNLWNRITPVELTTSNRAGLEGIIVNQSPPKPPGRVNEQAVNPGGPR